MTTETIDRINHIADEQGYAVAEVEPNFESLTEAAIVAGGLVGARSIGYLELNSSREDKWMLKHTESITQSEAELLGYFALGCIEPADKGGETVIYDGIKAAETIDAELPWLSTVKAHYTSRIYPGQSAVHPLVVETDQGRALRYRSRAATNQLLNLPDGKSEDDYYGAIEDVVDASDPYIHHWEPGQLLLVNNRITVHSRAPYEGGRTMIRYRFDDPHFATIPLH